MQSIIYGAKVYETARGTNAIYEAEYMGEPCYAIIHKQSDFVTLFDGDKRIFNSLMCRFRFGYCLSKEYDCARLPRFRLVKHDKKATKIDLRKYLYARYKKMPLSKVSGIVYVKEDNRERDNVLDLRRCNIYVPGESIEHREDISLSIVARPDKPDEQYIFICFGGDGKRTVEIVTYTPELLEMLSCPAFCKIEKNRNDGRAGVIVHYAPGGYVHDNLARFVLIYKLYFSSYINKRGGVKKFIKDYNILRAMHNGEDAAHINACKWNNCFENLCFMDRKVNQSMRDFVKWFSEPYAVYTAENSNSEILIEFSSIGLLKNREPSISYYRCATPEDFADWQKVFLGKTLTGKLQVATFATKDGVQQELTPCGMIKAGEVDKGTVKNNEPDFWVWAEHRDKLLSMDDSAFFPYRKQTSGTIDNTVNTVMAYLYGVIGGAGTEKKQ